MDKGTQIDNGKLTKTLKLQIVFSLALSIFWVIFLWGFWDRGVIVFGLNAFIFIFLLTILFLWSLYKVQKFSQSDLIWIIPIFFIELSFLIYENPFLKVISFLLLPVLFSLFYNYTLISNKKEFNWNFSFLVNTLGRILSFFSRLTQSAGRHYKLFIPSEKTNKAVIVKVIIGVVLLFVISLGVVIPLLSSADLEFANMMQGIVEWFRNLISEVVLMKIMFLLVLSVVIIAMISAWGKAYKYKDKENKKENLDPIISTIVLGGILLLYLLFLWVQLERLWVGSLPFDFKETEALVKSGFWQLFFLSIINILIYFFTYKKTNKFVQNILIAFTFASLLLLFSAGQRMILYVWYYGLSYEKFFAFYTVIFCTILFAWLIARLFMTKQANILKFLIVLFLWMYSVLTVFPVEQFIVRTNIKLASEPNSKIKLYEMTMLSADALPLIQKYKQQGVLNETITAVDPFTQEEIIREVNWSPWIRRQEQSVFSKKPYEMNIFNIIYLFYYIRK